MNKMNKTKKSKKNYKKRIKNEINEVTIPAVTEEKTSDGTTIGPKVTC